MYACKSILISTKNDIITIIANQSITNKHQFVVFLEVISVNVLRLQVMASENRFKWFVIVLYHKKVTLDIQKKCHSFVFYLCIFFLDCCKCSGSICNISQGIEQLQERQVFRIGFLAFASL